MKIYDEIISLEEHEPWQGAKYWYDKILEEGMGEEFISYLEDIFPEGLTRTELNAILWFEDELIEKFLGIRSEDDEA